MAVCPVCGKPIISYTGVITVGDRVYHKECFSKSSESAEDIAQVSSLLALKKQMAEAKEGGKSAEFREKLALESAEPEDRAELESLFAVKKTLANAKCEICQSSDGVNWIDGHYFCSKDSVFGSTMQQEREEEQILIEKKVPEAAQVQGVLISESIQEINRLSHKLVEVAREEQEAVTCPKCGEVVKPNWKACPSCGAVLSPVAKEEKKEETKEFLLLSKEVSEWKKEVEEEKKILSKEEQIISEEIKSATLPPKEKEKEVKQIIKDIRVIEKEVHKLEGETLKEEKIEKKVVRLDKKIDEVLEKKRMLFEKIKEFPEETYEQVSAKISELSRLLSITK
jgi:ribosomal protein L32